jgi:hypothetical protein
MHPAGLDRLRDQCAAAGTPFLFKQWGEWAPSTPEHAASNPRSGWQANRAHPCVRAPAGTAIPRRVQLSSSASARKPPAACSMASSTTDFRRSLDERSPHDRDPRLRQAQGAAELWQGAQAGMDRDRLAGGRSAVPARNHDCRPQEHPAHRRKLQLVDVHHRDGGADRRQPLCDRRRPAPHHGGSTVRYRERSLAR